MKRRQFVSVSLAAAGTAALAGCSTDDGIGGGNGGEDGESFPSYDIPAYSNWVPQDSRNEDNSGVFFTHLDWAALDETDDAPEDEDERTDDEETEELVEQVPILGLPFYGALISPFAIFGILFYPFSGDVLPEEGQTAEGIETETMTWVEDVLVFNGMYDPDVFAEQYADDFEEAETRDGFIVYVGTSGFAEDMAYAVSEDTLVVGMMPGEDDEYETEAVVSEALDRNLEEVDRAVDSDDGQWLFETTGDAKMGFGVLGTDDFSEALDTDDEVESDEHDEEPETDPEVDDNPVFDTVESLVNTLDFSVGDGEMGTMDVRFSGVYPDEESTPSEDEVREHLIGEEDVDHDIVIDGVRAHASATFEETPTDE